MKFKLRSAYFTNFFQGEEYMSESETYIMARKYFELLRPYIILEDDEIYIKVDKISELYDMLVDVQRNFEEIEYNSGCWEPTSVIISFRNMTITLGDYYLG